MPDPRVDSLLRRRFRRELTSLGSRHAGDFLDDPRTALAAVLLFDQLPRNLFRKSPRAYAYDRLACAIAGRACGPALRRNQRLALETSRDNAQSDDPAPIPR